MCPSFIMTIFFRSRGEERMGDERARNWHTFSVEFVADQPQEGKINDRKKHAL